MEQRLAVIAIGYKRTDCILRLLDSLNAADYGGDQIDLIISIDKSDTDEVEKLADRFNWKYGNKRVRSFHENMGLRNHIISCGEFLNEYEAVAVFEDDIVVSPSYYLYMKEAVAFYQDDMTIAGISLYSHYWNESAGIPFQPMISEYDTYFIQYAQSWGQVWLKKQWNEFKDWYDLNQNVFNKNNSDLFPKAVSNWPQTSWLKYHIRYCVEKNKFFVYPYISMTTNYTEPGMHYKLSITRFQVPYQMGIKKNYHFCNFSKEAVCYDCFFESLLLKRKLENKYEGITIDIGGQKDSQITGRYLVSTKAKNNKILKYYGLQLRPPELNILNEVPGKVIFIYDLSQNIKFKFGNKKNYNIKLFDYYMKERFLNRSEIVPFIKSRIRNLMIYIFH